MASSHCALIFQVEKLRRIFNSVARHCHVDDAEVLHMHKLSRFAAQAMFTLAKIFHYIIEQTFFKPWPTKVHSVDVNHLRTKSQAFMQQLWETNDAKVPAHLICRYAAFKLVT